MATGAGTVAAVLLVACGSSATTSSSSHAVSGGSATVVTSNAKVETHSGAMGTYLTDGSGRSLYMFAADSSGKSTCDAACLKFWPALTGAGTATVAGGATMSKLSTITGSDGAKQLAYAGHPLYYFALDSAAGDTKGQGNTGFGAKWWLLTPSGQPITAAPAPAPSTSSKSSGGGGWA